jgi:hypothetical protein
MMGRNPTIIVVELNEDRVVHHNRSVGGLINRAMGGLEKERLGFVKRIILVILNVIRIERWLNEDLETDWKWLQLKIEAEMKLWPLFSQRVGASLKHHNVPQDYVTFMREFLVFVLNWINGTNTTDFWKVLPIIRSIRDRANGELPSWGRKDPVFRQLVNFFYLHGN